MTKYWIKGSLLFLVSTLVPIFPLAWGQSEPFLHSLEAPAASTAPLAERQRSSIGPPQILELPLPETQPLGLAPPWQAERPEDNSPDMAPAVMPESDHAETRGYLGVRYATVEDGRTGVRVLDVIPGSPAARAGFFAPGPVSRESETVLNNAILLLLLTPAFPLGMLASVVHEIKHKGLHDREDVIVAVGEHPVMDAQEFNLRMHHFGPGDTVTFLVQRSESYIHLSAQLEAEPE